MGCQISKTLNHRNSLIGLVCLWAFLSSNTSLPGQQKLLTEKLSGEDLAQVVSDVTRFGDPVRGAIVFFRAEMNCNKCHEPNAQGRRLGPDLSERREISTEKLALSVLHPSTEIRAGFETTALMLADGRQISGIVVKEDQQKLTLDRIEESTQPLVISKSEIDERKLTSVSSMPEGLANQLSDRTQFLDLVRYLEEIAKGGTARAEQLRPTTSINAIAPLPAYESQIDHRGLIESWDASTLEKGGEIFRLRCASCHGDLESEGTMPTSLRFPSGKFKRGSEPFSMYQTLTHGYGMMNPQRWMVPKQKYAVIHYIRETFLRMNNTTQYFPVTEGYLQGLPAGNTLGPDPVESQPWTQMNYGPSLINTIEVSRDGSNIAQKGIAIRLDEGPGGVESGTHWIMYDHDTMRVAGAWSGQFIDYNGIHFNGVHGQHPHVAGSIHLQNPTGPGWARPGDESFADNRLQGRDDRRYGPLERSWAQYRGQYRFGQQTILRYTVGKTQILESPALQFHGGRPSFVRTLNLGPRDQDLVLQVSKGKTPFVFDNGSMLSLDEFTGGRSENSSTFDGHTFFQVEGAEKFDSQSHDFAFAARIKTESDGTIISKTIDQPQWMPNGQSLFLRGGRPTFDVGWVGAVQASTRVDDGDWHDIVLNWQSVDQKATFFIDGASAGSGVLAAKKALEGAVFRIGATNDNFPEPSFFRGEIADLKIFERLLSPAEIQMPESRVKAFAAWSPSSSPTIEDTTGNQYSATRSQKFDNNESSTGLFVTATSDNGPVARNAWSADEEGNLRLRIPAGKDPIRLNIHATSIAIADDVAAVQAALKKFTAPPANLQPLTKGGPANWPDVLETELKMGADSEAYAVDVLTHPAVNPFHCRMRFTGLDFVPNEDAAVVSTWDGSIWWVKGIGQKTESSKLAWRRIAAGLFQPLGIKIRDGVIFVTCRDQLVALHDLNGDGEMDWYECFNNDHQVTEHFHEFAMGLQIDAEGNFYYAKSARHALPALVPHHGTLLKVSADRQKTEIIANGFRAANGVCLNPDGSFVVTDQEGHWNPKNRINWVTKGGFYGNMFGYHDVTDKSDAAMIQPLCWITNAFDRSPAELLWVDSDRWGPLNGSLLNTSYGYGKIFVVPFEKVNGQPQGGMCALNLPQFPTGVMRGRFSPADGQLYCCGMFAWSGTQEQPGGLYRVRYTGRPVHLPTKLRATKSGLEIEFSDPVSADSANDPANFAIQVWDLKRSANYGSEHYNERRLPIASARLLEDGKTIKLAIPDIAPTWGMEIVYVLKTLDGKAIQGKIHNTIHALGDDR